MRTLEQRIRDHARVLGAWGSTNGGITYRPVPRPVGEFSNAGSVAAVSALTAFIFDPLDGMKVTTNGGRTFGDIQALDGAVWAGFTDDEVGYSIVNEQPSGPVRLWRTADAGAEWSMNFRSPNAVVVVFSADHAARPPADISLSAR